MTDLNKDQPAFPRTYVADGHNGMTLRDYFAGQALTSIPNRSWDDIGSGGALIKAWAKCAYAVADAMLEARAIPPARRRSPSYPQSGARSILAAFATGSDPMTYYVYKALTSGRRFKNWDFASEHENLDAAELAARGHCPKGEKIETEPGKDLERAFFGSALRDSWSAMISPVSRPASNGEAK